VTGSFLIAGLGNADPGYGQTRHNAGFWFLDALLRSSEASLRLQPRLSARVCRTRLFGADCVLMKPDTFMNQSGRAVRAVMDYYAVEPAGLLIAYDELDLPPGTARLKVGGGHGGHNGLRDVFRHLESTDFMRLRIGIGHPGHKDAVTGYVLSRPPADQLLAIMQAIDAAVAVMPDLLAGRLEAATKTLHSRD
jgi:PTH1 family peptidyl-tRNA hydrolase